MLIEQNFELRGPGCLGRICNPITGCFYDKTIISKEKFSTGLLFPAKLLHEAMHFTWAKSRTKFNPKMQDFKRGLVLNRKQKKDWTT